MKELAAQRQEFSSAAVGEETGESDTDKTAWQNMQQKAAQKLFGSYSHQFLLAAMGVVFPRKVTLPSIIFTSR
ncbi:MAG: hypothetical protein JWO80_3837 [Bryobacterales bacterium]|nr:hypothetical protein [Bryobacterales bacterium]